MNTGVESDRPRVSIIVRGDGIMVNYRAALDDGGGESQTRSHTS